MDVCLQVLKESNKSRFDNYSVRNKSLIISHITFRDCRVHSFCDNLSRNSCIWNVWIAPCRQHDWFTMQFIKKKKINSCYKIVPFSIFFFFFYFFYIFFQTGKKLTMKQSATKLKTLMEVFASPNRDSSTRLNWFTEEDH